MKSLILSLFFTVALWGYTPIQTGPAGNSSTGCSGITAGPLNCAFPSPITAHAPGNTMVVAVHASLTSKTATGVSVITDTFGTSYTLLSSVHDTFSGVWLYAASAPTAGGANTVAVTMNGTVNFLWITEDEFNGSEVTPTKAGSGGSSAATGSGLTYNCGAVTPDQNNTQIVAAFYGNQQSNSIVAESPLVSRVNDADSVRRQAMLADYFLATAAAVSPQAHNNTGGVTWSCAAAALVTGPTLTNISPSGGVLGAVVPITLSGTNLTGATSISAGAGITVSSIVVVSAISVTANFTISSGATPGTRSVTITTPIATSNSVTFTIDPTPMIRARGGSTFMGPYTNRDFSCVLITDQHPTGTGDPWVTNSAYVVNKQAAWNIQCVFFSGDIQAFGETMSTFRTHGWNSIISMGVPTLAAHGNHDCDTDTSNCTTRDTAFFDQFEGYDRVSAAAWGPVNAFSGVGDDVGKYDDSAGFGSKANYAIRFSVNGHKFLGIALEFGPRAAVRAWANNLAAFYPDHQVIWLTHQYLTSGGVTDNASPARPCQSFDAFCSGQPGYGFGATGIQLWDLVYKLNSNSRFTFSGHFIAGAGTRSYGYITAPTTVSPVHTVHQVYYDFQQLGPGIWSGAGKNDAILRISFHESTNTFDLFLMSSTTDTPYASWTGITWEQ